MDLPVVVAECPRAEHRVAWLCIWDSGNAASVVHMAFRNFILLPQQLGDVPVGLFDRTRQLVPQPREQRVAHNAHESSVTQRLAALFALPQFDFSFMQRLVAMLAQDNQVVRCIPTSLPALQMMDMQTTGFSDVGCAPQCWQVYRSRFKMYWRTLYSSYISPSW